MNGVYGGLIIIIMYAGSSGFDKELVLITENDIPILTESSFEILVEE